MVKDLIEQGVSNSYSYQEYRKRVSDLLAEGKSSGIEQTEDLLNYSKLNDSRMRRLDKTIKLGEDVEKVVEEKELDIVWLVLSEGWCGDAAQSLPVINKLAELNDGINLRIVFRDENEQLMDEFLTNGGRAIPKLIAYDSVNKEVMHSWGPRPSTATQMVNDYKEKHGSLDAEFKEDLQVWYNKDKGSTIAEDLLKIL